MSKTVTKTDSGNSLPTSLKSDPIQIKIEQDQPHDKSFRPGQKKFDSESEIDKTQDPDSKKPETVAEVSLFAQFVNQNRTRVVRADPSASVSDFIDGLKNYIGSPGNPVTVVHDGRLVNRGSASIASIGLTQDSSLQVYEATLVGGMSNIEYGFSNTPSQGRSRQSNSRTKSQDPIMSGIVEGKESEDDDEDEDLSKYHGDETQRPLNQYEDQTTIIDTKRSQGINKRMSPLSVEDRATITKLFTQAVPAFQWLSVDKQEKILALFQVCEDFSTLHVIAEDPDDKGYSVTDHRMREMAFDCLPFLEQKDKLEEALEKAEQLESQAQAEEVKFINQQIVKLKKGNPVDLTSCETLFDIAVPMPKSGLVRLIGLLHALSMNEYDLQDILMKHLPVDTFCSLDAPKRDAGIRISRLQLDFLNASEHFDWLGEEQKLDILRLDDKDIEDEMQDGFQEMKKSSGSDWWDFLDKLKIYSLKKLIMQAVSDKDVCKRLYPEIKIDDDESDSTKQKPKTRIPRIMSKALMKVKPDSKNVLAKTLTIIKRKQEMERKAKEQAGLISATPTLLNMFTNEKMEELYDRNTKGPEALDRQSKVNILLQCSDSVRDTVIANLFKHDFEEYQQVTQMLRTGEELYRSRWDAVTNAEREQKAIKKNFPLGSTTDSIPIPFLQDKDPGAYVQMVTINTPQKPALQLRIIDEAIERREDQQKHKAHENILQFRRYKEGGGFSVFHSHDVEGQLVSLDGDDKKRGGNLQLSLRGEVFFFTEQNHQFKLATVTKDKTAHMVEISKDSKLHERLRSKPLSPKDIENGKQPKIPQGRAPALTQIGSRKVIAFTLKEDDSTALYFYDIEAKTERLCFKAAQLMFVYGRNEGSKTELVIQTSIDKDKNLAEFGQSIWIAKTIDLNEWVGGGLSELKTITVSGNSDRMLQEEGLEELYRSDRGFTDVKATNEYVTRVKDGEFLVMKMMNHLVVTNHFKIDSDGKPKQLRTYLVDQLIAMRDHKNEESLVRAEFVTKDLLLKLYALPKDDDSDQKEEYGTNNKDGQGGGREESEGELLASLKVPAAHTPCYSLTMSKGKDGNRILSGAYLKNDRPCWFHVYLKDSVQSREIKDYQPPSCRWTMSYPLVCSITASTAGKSNVYLTDIAHKSYPMVKIKIRGFKFVSFIKRTIFKDKGSKTPIRAKGRCSVLMLLKRSDGEVKVTKKNSATSKLNTTSKKGVKEPDYYLYEIFNSTPFQIIDGDLSNLSVKRTPADWLGKVFSGGKPPRNLYLSEICEYDAENPETYKAAIVYQTDTTVFFVGSVRDQPQQLFNDEPGAKLRMMPIDLIQEDDQLIAILHDTHENRSVIKSIDVVNEVFADVLDYEKAYHGSAIILAAQRDLNDGLLFFDNEFKISNTTDSSKTTIESSERLTIALKKLAEEPFTPFYISEQSIVIDGRVFTRSTNFPVDISSSSTQVCGNGIGSDFEGFSYVSLPTLRVIPLIGPKQETPLLFIFITGTKILLKLPRSASSKGPNQPDNKDSKTYYWAVMDTSGHVCKMPMYLQRELNRADWTYISIFETQNRTTMLMLNAEKTFSCIELDQMGDVQDVKNFDTDLDERYKNQNMVFYKGQIVLFAMKVKQSGEDESDFKDEYVEILSSVSESQGQDQDHTQQKEEKDEKLKDVYLKVTTQILYENQQVEDSDRHRDTQEDNYQEEPKQPLARQSLTKVIVEVPRVDIRTRVCGDYLCFSEGKKQVNKEKSGTGDDKEGCKEVKKSWLSRKVLALDVKDILSQASEKEQDNQLKAKQVHYKSDHFTPFHCTAKILPLVHDQATNKKKTEVQETERQANQTIVEDQGSKSKPKCYKSQHSVNYLQIWDIENEKIVIYDLTAEQPVPVLEKSSINLRPEAPFLRDQIKVNSSQTLLLSNHGGEDDSAQKESLCLEQSFSSIDICQAQALQRDEYKLEDFNWDTLFCTFDGTSIVSLLDQDKLEQIENLIKSQDEDVFGPEQKRELGTILQMEENELCRVDKFKDHSTKEEYTQEDFEKYQSESLTRSLTRRTFESLKVNERDTILRISALCEEKTALQTIDSVKSFTNPIQMLTQQVLHQFDTCFIETVGTKTVQELNWPKGVRLMTFRRDNCLITQNEAQKEINKKFGPKVQKVKHTTVKVRMLELTMLYREKDSFTTFLKMLVDAKNNAVFQTQLVDLILKEHWDGYYWMIFREQLIPFVVHFICSMTFLVLLLHPDAEGASELPLNIFAIIVVLTSLFTAWRESYQASSKGYKDYLRSFWNILDILSILSMLSLVLLKFGFPGIVSLEQKRVFGAFCAFALLVKMYDWLRLFSDTAFYLQLIENTIWDIRFFGILFFLSLALFGVPIMFLNFNNDESNLIVPVSGFIYLDAVLSQYVQTLNGYDTEAFPDDPFTYICVVLYLLATLFTQITMLNMLIAIMGDTFGRITENKQIMATRTKLEFLDDYAFIIKKSLEQNNDKRQFLFVVTTCDAQDQQEEEWSGQIARIQTVMNKAINDTKTDLTKQIDNLKNDKELKSSLKNDFKSIKDSIDSLVKVCSNNLSRGQKTAARDNHIDQDELTEIKDQVNKVSRGNQNFERSIENVQNKIDDLKRQEDQRASRLDGLESKVEETGQRIDQLSSTIKAQQAETSQQMNLIMSALTKLVQKQRDNELEDLGK